MGKRRKMKKQAKRASKQSKRHLKRKSTAGLILDLVLIFATGGLWLIWILIRYLRNS